MVDNKILDIRDKKETMKCDTLIIIIWKHIVPHVGKLETRLQRLNNVSWQITLQYLTKKSSSLIVSVKT